VNPCLIKHDPPQQQGTAQPRRRESARESQTESIPPVAVNTTPPPRPPPRPPLRQRYPRFFLLALSFFSQSFVWFFFPADCTAAVPGPTAQSLSPLRSLRAHIRYHSQLDLSTLLAFSISNTGTSFLAARIPSTRSGGRRAHPPPPL
jgi:hypothetical protein